MIKVLGTKYREQPVAIGLSSGGKLIEVLAFGTRGNRRSGGLRAIGLEPHRAGRVADKTGS